MEGNKVALQLEAWVLEVRGTGGWHQEYPLQKSIIHIGSDPRNDIVLESGHGAAVAPRHLQLVAIQGDTPKYRAINLGDEDIAVATAATRQSTSRSPTSILAPRSSTDIVIGTSLRLGDLSFVFRAEAVPPPPEVVPPGEAASSADSGRTDVAPRSRVGIHPPADQSRLAASIAYGGAQTEGHSADIGLKLHLTQTSLDPEHPVEGTIIVRNLGNTPGVQFMLELDGLEPDSYEMGPGPILFPNAEREVFLRLHHPRKPYPPAGAHRVSIRALAPEAYPGQSVVVTQNLQILPFYSHKLRFLTDERAT